MGDAILAEYQSVVEAVKSALQIQAELRKHNQTLPEEEQIMVRIGIHVGDVVEANGDIFGDGVNITARLQPLAEPGGVCISSIVYNQIKNMPEFHSISLGTRQLKNIKEPVEILKLVPARETSWLERTKSSVGVFSLIRPRQKKIAMVAGVFALISLPVLAVLDPFASVDPLDEKRAVVEEQIRIWERLGWDPAPVADRIHEFERLRDEGRDEESDQVLEEALSILERGAETHAAHPPAEAWGGTNAYYAEIERRIDHKIREFDRLIPRFEAAGGLIEEVEPLHQSFMRLIEQGKLEEAEAHADHILEILRSRIRGGR